MDSLNFVQVVSGPTHQKGHTLDLFYLGFSVTNLKICDAAISDVVFDSVLACTLPKSYHSLRFSRCFNSSTARTFNDMYIPNPKCCESPLMKWLIFFNSNCYLGLNCPLEVTEIQGDEESSAEIIAFGPTTQSAQSPLF